MSSLRNAAPRRPHKERSQPEGRSKWGLLEKHKDYSLRARDYAQKRQKLAALQSKARERNPDEFAFGMLSSDKSTQGKHGRGEGEAKLSVDAVRLLKTQDAGYLRTVGQKGRREVEELEKDVTLQRLVASDEERPRKGRKVVWVDGDTVVDEQKNKENNDGHGEAEDQDEDEDDESRLEPHKSKRLSRKELLAAHDALARARYDRKRRKRLGEARAAKLDALKNRQKEIMAAAEQLELQRAKMAKSIGGTNRDGVKFKIRERRR
ncbi:MAG: hypothetical protein Q9227_000173 [Pyrenula ochraceoflavens]